MNCQDKIKYPSEEHAYKGAKKAHRKGLINIRHYKCPYCNNWHLTSQSKKS